MGLQDRSVKKRKVKPVAFSISYTDGKGSVLKSIEIKVDERRVLLVGLCPTAKYPLAPLLAWVFPLSMAVSTVRLG